MPRFTPNHWWYGVNTGYTEEKGSVQGSDSVEPEVMEERCTGTGTGLGYEYGTETENGKIQKIQETGSGGGKGKMPNYLCSSSIIFEKSDKIDAPLRLLHFDTATMRPPPRERLLHPNPPAQPSTAPAGSPIATRCGAASPIAA
ncbi:hypothetical protein E3N88_15850 [Mikania micrantha]|uniref:Uncharacterized protein n=1 Tax=Mikania micrantha TaxID=192012 RepID=A0A5N6NWK4_9ASTR|nr:hypothetical protein E3N88_15850 [Mikania micrantha]